ncbi:MAG: tetratricopeptide repeat protein [Kiritimatiellae bacterium]|nr:tetratricopeptide repeat protein [Kiritimatiellia bacterium]
MTVAGRAAAADRRPRAAAIAAVALLTWVTYLPAIHNGWTNWDDTELLLKDARWHGFSPANLVWMWTTTRLGHYQPVTWMSYALDYHLWGVNAAGLHLTNTVLHAITAALLTALLLRWLERAGWLGEGAGALECAWVGVAALLWSLHPLRVEAVAWITARRDLLSALFCAWSLWFWLPPPGLDAPDRGRCAAATATGVAAMLSKGQAMVLPVLVVIMFAAERAATGAARDAAGWRRGAIATLPLWAAALVIALVSARGAAVSGAAWSWASHGLAARAIQSAWSLARQLVATVWPAGLTPLIPLPRPWNPWAIRWLAPAMVTSVVYLSLPLWARRAPALACALLWIAAAIAPVSGWLQSGPQLTADRYSYVASWSLATVSAALLLGGFRRLRGPQHRPIAVAVGAAVMGGLVVLASVTRAQIRVWRDPVSLWSRAIAVHPDSAIAHANLAEALADAGEPARALEHYANAVRLDPALLAPRAGWATLAARLGATDAARAQFEAILKADPRHEAALIGLANLDLLDGRTNDALRRYEAAFTAHPDSAEAAYNLATLRLRLGDVRRARELLEPLVMRQPHHALAWHNLGIARQREGDRLGAAEAYRRAIELAPELARLHPPAAELR